MSTALLTVIDDDLSRKGHLGTRLESPAIALGKSRVLACIRLYSEVGNAICITCNQKPKLKSAQTTNQTDKTKCDREPATFARRTNSVAAPAVLTATKRAVTNPQRVHAKHEERKAERAAKRAASAARDSNLFVAADCLATAIAEAAVRFAAAVCAATLLVAAAAPIAVVRYVSGRN